MTSPVLAIRAKSVLTLAGESPARGVQLFAALKKIDNAVLLVRDGLVEDVRPWAQARLPVGARVRDVGPVCLAPGCVNAHVHLELSHLAGRTLWGKGFTPWLESLIPLLGAPPGAAAAEALASACADLADTIFSCPS